MTIDFILFEKKAENDKPVWDDELVKEFCEEQKLDYKDIKEETLFYVVRIAPETEDEEEYHYRLIEITQTISFIVKDDPSLDEITELDAPSIDELKEMKALNINESEEYLKEGESPIV